MIPELLSPVSNMEMCKAAVHNGADAIYVGAPNFNARRRENDLSIGALKEITHYARIYDVKVYFACNILVFDKEIKFFAERAKDWIELAPDAVIVQDVGLARWFKKCVPSIPIHASTQMTITDSNGVKLAEELGISRVVLARELSIKQIAKIRKDCPNMELEVFAHGALCVSYSGQCNASLYFGGRSANRGECAQCCRLPYKIFDDGKFCSNNGKQVSQFFNSNDSFLNSREGEKAYYPFSAKDLCALPVLNELLDAGVDSLKIEGRLKSAEYVASVTRAYSSSLRARQNVSEKYNTKSLETIFSRGFTTGWLKENEKQIVVDNYTTGHRGFFIGKVKKVHKQKIYINTVNEKNTEDLNVAVNAKFKEDEIYLGDGVLITADKSSKEIFGGKIYGIKRDGEFLCLEFARDKKLHNIKSEFSVYINKSERIEKDVMNFEEKKNPVNIILSGKVGEPFEITINDITVKSDEVLEETQTSELSRAAISHALAMTKNSHTPYICESPIINVSPNAFVNQKMVRKLRQKALDMLNEKKIKRETPKIEKYDYNQKNKNNFSGGFSLEKSSSVNDFNLEERNYISCDKIDTPYNKTDAAANYITVRSLGDFYFLKKLKKENSNIKLLGDYSLNIANSLSAEYFLENGIDKFYPSLDLDKNNLQELKKNFGEFLEIPENFFKPAFHTRHCLFSAIFSDNKIFPKCGQPCKFHTLEVEDRKGERHIVAASPAANSNETCRNTIFIKPGSNTKKDTL